MNWIFLTLVCLISTSAIAEPIARVTTRDLNIIQTDLNAKAIKVQIVSPKLGSVESFSSMIKRTHPIAAINGGFFCLQSLKPVGDLRTKTVCFLNALGYDIILYNNTVKFLLRDEARKLNGDLLGLGPRLVWNGVISVDPKSEGYNGSVHYTSQIRTTVGVTKANKLIFAVSRYNVTLTQLARLMMNYGCTYAFGLDGGSSIGLYYKGKYIVGPGRAVANFIVTYQ